MLGAGRTWVRGEDEVGANVVLRAGWQWGNAENQK